MPGIVPSAYGTVFRKRQCFFALISVARLDCPTDSGDSSFLAQTSAIVGVGFFGTAVLAISRSTGCSLRMRREKTGQDAGNLSLGFLRADA